MATARTTSTKLIWAIFMAMLFQNMVVHVMARNLQGIEDQKTYYPPDPHTPRTTPTTPSHTPPSHGSHGGGSKNCGTPSRPSHGGGGYYHSPPTGTPPVVLPPPATITPLPPSIPVTPSTPSSPPVITDPNTPPFVANPSTPPLLPSPTPPFFTDPNIPPFIIGTCNFWRTHPNFIWGLFGYWGTVGSTFGFTTTPAFTPGLSLMDALANTRNDGYGALYREGTASLLNSLATKNFSYTTQQVKDKFSSSLASNKAAAAQAKLFKQANEGKLKIRT